MLNAESSSVRQSERVLAAAELECMSQDDLRRELDNGVLVMMAPVGGEHGDIAATITDMLRQYVMHHKLGRVYTSDAGFILTRNPDTVLAPDVAFVRRERLPGGRSPSGFLPFSPDLAVEILSPGDSIARTEAKIQRYLDAGTHVAWLVNPRTRTVVEYQRGKPASIHHEQDVLTAATLFADLALPVCDIFQ